MLEIVPMTLREANAFVEQNHRHHGATVGHKFSIGLSDGEKIVGVAIVGRPVSRHLDDGWTLEVNRLCTDGTRNACSMLYAAAWRAARAMGYKRVGLGVWDYSNQPGNVLGQICPAFGLLWFFIMPLAIWAEDTTRYLIWAYDCAVYHSQEAPPTIAPYSLKSVYGDFICGR